MLSSVEQYGLTVTFDQPYPVGQYANGDYFVVGPVQVTGFSPAPEMASNGWTGPVESTKDWYRHGAMVNPSPGDIGNLGYGTQLANNYVQSKDISRQVPATVGAGSTIVWTTARDAPQQRPSIDTAIAVTVVSQAPASGDFRPPYCGTDKTSKHNIADINWSLIPTLPTVSGAPDPTALAGSFQRVWLDHRGFWSGRKIHPRTSMPDYGNDMAKTLGQGFLALMLNFTQSQKQALLVNLLQIGVDNYGIVADGGTQIWEPDGGHNHGRKLPILFAGTVLGDATMADIGSRNDVFFGEDAQTFYVTSETVSVGSNYTSGMIGLPEYGIRHATTPSLDNGDWNASYRICCTGPGYGPHVLAAHMMGLKEAWQHDPLFDYADRYRSIQGAGAWDVPFTNTMWETYRGDYPPVWSA